MSCCHCQPPTPVTMLAQIHEDLANVYRHLHELKEEVVTTKQEFMAQLGELNGTFSEFVKDVNRLADKFDEAIAAGDMSEASALVAELRGKTEQADSRVEQSSPEPTEEPAPSDGGEQPVDGGDMGGEPTDEPAPSEEPVQ